jgi:hypothetical protein
MKLFVLVSVACLTGCVDDTDAVEIGTAPPFVLQEVDDLSGRPVLVSDDLESPPIPLSQSVCGCADNACAVGVLEEVVGCGVAVTVGCNDGRLLGGWVPCPDRDEQAALMATPY